MGCKIVFVSDANSAPVVEVTLNRSCADEMAWMRPAIAFDISAEAPPDLIVC